MRNSPATKGTKYLSREDKRLRHRASCHGEAEREGNAMSLDRPGQRESQRYNFSGSASPEAFVMW